MLPYQERVVTERKELNEKLEKLEIFLHQSNKVFSNLPRDEQFRLQKQYGCMREYLKVLDERIAAFEPTTKVQVKAGDNDSGEVIVQKV